MNQRADDQEADSFLDLSDGLRILAKAPRIIVDLHTFRLIETPLAAQSIRLDVQRRLMALLPHIGRPSNETKGRVNLSTADFKRAFRGKRTTNREEKRTVRDSSS